MADTSIEWTQKTPIVDRGGRRVRYYIRKRPESPGRKERALRRAQGQAWCRRCRAWLPLEAVRPGGLCRPHRNEVYRLAYAAGGRVAIAARVHARKRGVAPVPAALAEDLHEEFDGLCAYCPAPATTWDHLVPVKHGGRTVPGNIVPACLSCNSRKGTKPPEAMPWRSDRLIDILALADALSDSRGIPADLLVRQFPEAH